MAQKDDHDHYLERMYEQLAYEGEKYIASSEDLAYLVRHFWEPDDLDEYRKFLAGICRYIQNASSKTGIIGEWGIDGILLDYRDRWTSTEKQQIEYAMRKYTERMLSDRIPLASSSAYPSEREIKSFLRFWIWWTEDIYKFLSWLSKLPMIIELSKAFLKSNENITQYMSEVDAKASDPLVRDKYEVVATSLTKITGDKS